MYCLENMKRISYPTDLVMNLTKLYRFKGKDFYYEDVYKNDMQTLIKDTIEKDTFYASSILKLNVTENRLRLIIRKNSTPKTNDEKIVANLKKVFEILQAKGSELELESNEYLSLAKMIFGDIIEIGFRSRIVETQFNLLKEKKKESLRITFEFLLNIYKKLLVSNEVEATQLATNIYVDIYNLEIFDKMNDFLCLLIYYCLLFKERFNVFRYVSFFELYINHEDEFKNALVTSSFNWESGFAQTSILNTLTINMMLEGYEAIEAKTDAYTFDKRIRKIDTVEGTILKMGEIFTKEEIRKKNPYFSDSTINRALENLKRQNKIRPNGTGRSATWIRITNDEPFDPRNRQVNMFELIDD